VVIDVKSGKMKTRRGKVYTRLNAGLVMIVAGVKFSGNTVYLKLLSSQVYDKHHHSEKRPSRVGVMLGFKFPDAMLGNTDLVLNEIGKWVQAFPDEQSAAMFAGGSR
jgi:hypothetical protein